MTQRVLMAEGEPLDLFSGRKSSSDDKLCHSPRGNGESKSLDPAEVTSSSIPTATGSELEVTGATEKSEAYDLDTKRGLKRSREIEPMDHSGSYQDTQI